MKTMGLEYVKTMSLYEAESELNRRVYDAALFLEELENAGKLLGNGHHQAQSVAQFAVDTLKKNWQHNGIS